MSNGKITIVRFFIFYFFVFIFNFLSDRLLLLFDVCVIIKKEDGMIRYCIRVNAIRRTVFADSETKKNIFT